MVNIPVIQKYESSPWNAFASGIGTGLGGAIEQSVSDMVLRPYLKDIDVNNPSSIQAALSKAPPHLIPRLTQAIREQQSAFEQTQKAQQFASLMGMIAPEAPQAPQQPREPREATQQPRERKPYEVPKGSPRPPEVRDARQMASIGMANPNAARAIASADAVQEERFRRQVASHEKISDPIIQRANELQEKTLGDEQRLDAMMDSIVNGDVSFFSRDNIADRFNIPLLRTAKGSQFLSIGKDLYVAEVSQLGGQTVRNQWIEKKLSDAFQKMGANEYANAAITEYQRFIHRLRKSRVDKTQEIANDWRDQLGYVPAQLSAEVNKQMQSEVKEANREFAKRLKDIESAEKSKTPLRTLPQYRDREEAITEEKTAQPIAKTGTVRMKFPDRTIRNIPERDVSEMSQYGEIIQ
jgi:phage FluMu protein gp41